MTNAETVREEVVNALLAELLRDHGIDARAERRSRKGVPDVRIKLRTGDLVLLDCKWEGSAGPLEDQLDKRLHDFPEALALLGVLYPQRIRRAADTSAALGAATDIQWWLHGSRGTKRGEPRRLAGSATELADQVRTLPLELEGVDRVVAAAAAVGYALGQASDQIAKHARIAQRIADIIASTDQEKDRAAALRIGCLVLFNALAFQDRLAVVNGDVPTVTEALRQGVPGLRAAWRRICDDIDYVPVFELASDILNVLGDAPPVTHAAALAPLVQAMEDTRRLEGHDLSGRLFHTLLTEAKFSGAYYTSVPAATLLSRLVFHDWPSHVDWSDHEFPASLNVADLACGTGTLLMAVASEVGRRHREAGGQETDALQKAMVEQALHGYDVQLSAVHFAATSLAMLNPRIQFDRLNLYVMPLGAEGSTVSLGSLDFLGENQAAVQFALSGEGFGVRTRDPARVSGSGPAGVEQGITATLPELDLAIMNPPFTRSVGGNLLFGSLPAAQRKELQRELSRRLRERRLSLTPGASATAGLGAAFVATASPKLRRGEGRLALVLPATVCTGPSWQETRALIEQDFILDMVVASHDSRRWNFSDSTSLSEVLLVATRRPENRAGSEPPTVFVNLWQNPDGVLDAQRVAQAITTTAPARIEGRGTALLEVGGQHVGETFSIPKAMIAGKKWYGVQFARADVARSALRLLGDSKVWIPGEPHVADVALCPLNEIGRVGPDRRDVWDAFERTESVTAYPMVENHDTQRRTRLVADPDTYLAPLARARPGRNRKKVSQIWPKAGRLLVAERLRLNTTRVVALRSDVNVLSNVWWPVRMSDAAAEKALAAWLNSSLGLLTLLSERTSTEGSWTAIKKADLEALPVLDIRHLPALRIQALADLFDELADEDFERLPDMAHCRARRALDDGVSRVLGFPELRSLRELLASEPAVSNRPM